MIGKSVELIPTKHNTYKELSDYYYVIVSEDGLVYNKIKGEYLRTYTDIYGYVRVTIGRKSYLLHRLVALLFVDKPQEDLVIVCHKNKNRLDNRAINLMWSDNNFINIRRSDFNRKNLGRSIVGFKIGSNEPLFFENGGEASRQLGLNRSEVYRCCKGQRKSTGGYRFMYGSDYTRIYLGWELD